MERGRTIMMKNTVLEFLKKTDGYVSGEELSSTLSVSRTAIWKVITQLKKEGYEIESVTRKGYRMVQTPDLLMAQEIQYGLQTTLLGKEVIWFQHVGSTNEEAKKLGTVGAKEGTLVVAEEQRAGKGRLGRAWVSPPQKGIWMSLLLRPRIIPMDASKITLLAGLAVCEAIHQVTGLEAQIKWPNDIVIHGKKVCGILTEMSAEMERVNYIIVGIGINVNTECFPEELQNTATSLCIEAQQKVSRIQLLQRILCTVESYYLPFMATGAIESILPIYKKHCATIDRDVKVSGRNIEVLGRAVDITKNGELVVRKEDGEMITVLSGEVSVRGVYGYI